jgi:outer membrane protein assembly factor BamB
LRALLHRILATALTGLGVLAAGSGPVEAQLSTSRWPMLGHDVRHTGQSELLGPDFSSGAPAANQVRAVPFVDKIKMHPVVGQNGDVYVGMGWQFCSLKALDVSNPANPVFLPNTAWNSPARSDPGCQPTNADVSASSAAIDQNGYIYFGDRDNSVYKFRGSDGQRMWTYNHGHEGDHHSSPAIAADGTVYFVFSQNTDGNGSILAVKNTGDTVIPPPAVLPDSYIKWKLAVGQFASTSSPALITTTDSPGTLGCTLGTAGCKTVMFLGFADGRVRAIKDNGTSGAVIWSTHIGPLGANVSILASPVIGADGTVYIGTGVAGASGAGLYALDRTDGHIKWTYPISPGIVDSTAALRTVGNTETLYFVSRSGNQRTVHAINPAAVTPANPQAGLLWTYGPTTASMSSAGGFPIIGADGVIYVGMGSGVYALEPTNGTLLWKYLTQNGIISSPVLGPPKLPTPEAPAVLYIGSQDKHVYAITDAQGGSSGGPPGAATLRPSPRARPRGDSGTLFPPRLLWVNDGNAQPSVTQWFSAPAAGTARAGTCADAEHSAGRGGGTVGRAGTKGLWTWSVPLDFTVALHFDFSRPRTIAQHSDTSGTRWPGRDLLSLGERQHRGAKITQWFSADAGARRARTCAGPRTPAPVGGGYTPGTTRATAPGACRSTSPFRDRRVRPGRCARPAGMGGR